MNRSVIIVAGGKGVRMGATTAKQFLLVKGIPVLVHTVRAFQHALEEAQMVLVLPADQLDEWDTIAKEHRVDKVTVVEGGKERSDSVRNGLDQVTGEVVGVHDGVRPLVSEELIKACFETAEESGTGVPAIPVSSSIRRIDGASNRAMDRSVLRAVQTPQCFLTNILRSAFEQQPRASTTDEATLVEQSGYDITLVNGEERNIKITTPFDLVMAEAYLSEH